MAVLRAAAASGGALLLREFFLPQTRLPLLGGEQGAAAAKLFFQPPPRVSPVTALPLLSAGRGPISAESLQQIAAAVRGERAAFSAVKEEAAAFLTSPSGRRSEADSVECTPTARRRKQELFRILNVPGLGKKQCGFYWSIYVNKRRKIRKAKRVI